jgi:hypothetical protein
MKCGNCGTRNPSKSKFCKECGQELRVTGTPPAVHTVIIRSERRSVIPGLIWILVGMVLVVLLIGLLIWTDIIDVPYDLRVRLPDWLGELVDAIEDARPPGGSTVSAPGGNPPGNPGQGQPPQVPPAACNEDLLANYGTYSIEECVTESGIIWLTFKAPLLSDAYDVVVRQADPPGGILFQDQCELLFDADRLPICTWDCFRWEPGALAITIRPAGLDCIVGDFYLSMPRGPRE